MPTTTRNNRAEWVDLVRGQQSIDTSSVSDPVLIREDGSFLYTMPSVADDVDYLARAASASRIRRASRGPRVTNAVK